jgi:outer membrane lipoprotein SlyB
MTANDRNTKTARPAVATAVIATICGAVVGGVVATAMGRNLHMYQRFIGLLVVVALCAVGAWVHQTFIKSKGVHVEETKADTTP